MALSGYNFLNPTSILPYLEPRRIGPTSLLARSLARRLGCHVVAGYPEALSSSEGSSGPESSAKEVEGDGDGDGVGWNSAMVVGPSGEVVGNYRKTFRFETDKNWAREGASFFDLTRREGIWKAGSRGIRGRVHAFRLGWTAGASGHRDLYGWANTRFTLKLRTLM